MNRLKTVHFAAVGKELHIDVPLSNVAIDYQPPNMIADMLAPVVPVPNISGIIPSFSRGDLLRVPKTFRAPGTQANRVQRDISSDNFYCRNWALMDGVTVEDRYNADPIYVQKLFEGGIQFIKTGLMMDWEARLANLVTSGANVGSYAAVTSAWTDTSTNSDPLGDVLTAIDNVQDTNGIKPNKVLMGDKAWRYFRRNVAVRNLIFGINNGGGYPNTAQVANLLDIDTVLVGGAYQDTGHEGQAENLQQIWGGNVLVYFAPDAPSIAMPSFLYSFRWSTAGIPNMQVERHPYDSKAKIWDFELGYYQDEKVTGASYGFLLTGAA